MSWVNVKGVRRFVGPRPDDEEDDPTVRDVIERLKRNLHATEPHDPYLVTRPLYICECGCALGREDASCPNCLLWAERNAISASWTQATIWKVA